MKHRLDVWKKSVSGEKQTCRRDRPFVCSHPQPPTRFGFSHTSGMTFKISLPVGKQMNRTALPAGGIHLSSRPPNVIQTQMPTWSYFSIRPLWAILIGLLSNLSIAAPNEFISKLRQPPQGIWSSHPLLGGNKYSGF